MDADIFNEFKGKLEGLYSSAYNISYLDPSLTSGYVQAFIEKGNVATGLAKIQFFRRTYTLFVKLESSRRGQIFRSDLALLAANAKPKLISSIVDVGPAS
jgi:hypothetical protein